MLRPPPSRLAVVTRFIPHGGTRVVPALRRGPMPRRIPTVARIVQANVVAIDQCLVINRFGTAMPNGMIFALRRDIVSNTDPRKEDLQTRRRGAPRQESVPGRSC